MPLEVPLAASNVTIQDLLAHQAWVRALARSLVGGQVEADDIEQATWVAALERPPPHGRNLRAWLGRVVRRRRVDHLRAEQRRTNRERGVPPRNAQGGPELLLVRGELRARLAQEVLGLDEPYRSTLLLRFYEDVEPGEIARIQGVPVATVRTRQHRAIQQLRQRMAGPTGDLRRVLAPVLGPSPFALGPSGTGVVVAATKTKLWLALCAGLVLVAAAFTWIALDPGGSSSVGSRSDTTVDEGHTDGDAPVSPALLGTSSAGGAEPPAASDLHTTGGAWEVRSGAALPTGEIVGVVNDEKGRPLPRVAALLQAVGVDAEQRMTTTDAKGRFRFSGVEERSRVLVLHYGAATLRRRVTTGEKTLAITLAIDVPLPAGVSVQRAAARGVLGGAVRDAMGVALPGCKVRLLDEGGRDTLQETVTDHEGEFRFDNLDAGIHALYFASETTRLFARARVGQWLSVALRTPMPLGGVVVAADTGDPVAGVLVEVFQDGKPGAARRFARTDERGAFSFSVPDGAWRLVVGKVRGSAVSSLVSEFLPQDVGSVSAGSTDLRVVLERGGEVAGALRGPGGEPATTGVVVRATPVTPEGTIDYAGVRMARAREDGTFRIPGLTGKTVELTATGTLEGRAVFAHMPRVPVGATGLIVDLREGEPISILLADSAGEPVSVSGGWIHVRPAGSKPGGARSVGARLQADGRYVTPALDPSLSYVVVAGGFRGYAPGERARVRAGDRDVVVRLAGVRFAGQLLDSEGEPVVGARIEAWALGADIPTHAWTETDDDGVFALPGAPTGSVQVVAVVSGKRVQLGKHDTPRDAVTLRLP